MTKQAATRIYLKGYYDKIAQEAQKLQPVDVDGAMGHRINSDNTRDAREMAPLLSKSYIQAHGDVINNPAYNRLGPIRNPHNESVTSHPSNPATTPQRYPDHNYPDFLSKPKMTAKDLEDIRADVRGTGMANKSPANDPPLPPPPPQKQKWYQPAMDFIKTPVGTALAATVGAGVAASLVYAVMGRREKRRKKRR